MGMGEALLDFWKRGLKMTPKPAISFDCYRSFIEYLVNSEAHTWFSKIIIFAELAVAAGLILGAFVGVAAFFGGMMNWSFIMAGSASTNGMLFAIATWLVLGWHNCPPSVLPGNPDVYSTPTEPLTRLNTTMNP